jgi:hypothetical protein
VLLNPLRPAKSAHSNKPAKRDEYRNYIQTAGEFVKP